MSTSLVDKHAYFKDMVGMIFVFLSPHTYHYRDYIHRRSNIGSIGHRTIKLDQHGRYLIRANVSGNVILNDSKEGRMLTFGIAIYVNAIDVSNNHMHLGNISEFIPSSNEYHRFNTSISFVLNYDDETYVPVWD